jgi:tyrosyl-tRNA synthetase
MTAEFSLSQWISDLRSRGLIAQISHEEELNQLLSKGPFREDGTRYAAYCGVDPTAPSMHVGNLASLMMLRRAQDAGLMPIVLFGGATGLIGDPTGRTEMRQMHSAAQITEYIENFTQLSRRYFRFDVENKPVFVNNIDWFGNMSWIDFFRNIGVHFTVARLLSAEVNRTRYEEGGLTFMELGYQLLQSYDFLHLYQKHNCIIQFGGNDQWSNILGGADLIRRVVQGKAFAVTTPLLVGSDGKKFGKTAGNAIWLDARMTSPYELFQFFRNVHDNDIQTMLRVFTHLSLDDIQSILSASNINDAKERMAFEITKIIHGVEESQKALETSKALFSNGGVDISSVPTTPLSKEELEEGLDVLALLIKCGLSPSRGEARKLVVGGGVSLNGEKCVDFAYKISLIDFKKDSALLVKKGKKDFHRVVLEA